MSALPRLTPRATPLSATPTVYDTYPPRLPSALDIPQRVNPLLPPPPQLRTTMLETVDPHWNNDYRTLRMKQREHYRYHNAWSKYYYGAPPEKESYRSHIRNVLKEQMSDQWIDHRFRQSAKVTESQDAVEKDRKDRADDMLSLQRKNTFLMSYRDENKKLMENRWTETRRSRENENKYDREQLKYNPINWSCSLK